MAGSYSPSFIVANNAVLVLWIVISVLALSMIHPVLATAYSLIVIIGVGYLLRKHLCTTCTYYGRACGYGWGLLTSRFFPPNAGNRALGERLAGPIWAIIIAPLAASAYLLLERGNMYYLAALTALLPVLIVLKIETCKRCEERTECPLSSAKK